MEKNVHTFDHSVQSTPIIAMMKSPQNECWFASKRQKTQLIICYTNVMAKGDTSSFSVCCI